MSELDTDEYESSFSQYDDEFDISYDSLLVASRNASKLLALLAEHPSAEILNQVDEQGDSLLHHAVKRDGYEMVRLLVEAKISLNVVNKKGETPLYMVFDRYRVDLAKLLADADACIDPEYEAEHANELRLWTAVLRGDLDDLRRRIDAGDSVDQAPQGGTARGWTALWLAVALGREDAARMLIQAGADVNAAGHNEDTPLHLALLNDHFDITKLLVEAKANVNAADNSGRVPLHLALNKCNLDMARVLVEAGANVDATDKEGMTPLHWASSKGHLEVVKLLVEAGANVDVTDRDDSTPLHWASSYGHLEVVELLVEAGANIHATDEDGRTPLHYSLSTSDNDVIPNFISKTFTLLTDAGATVNGATAEISPLVPSDVIRAIVPEDTHFWLAANNDAPMLAAELARGLDPNMKTENGMTLLHWACAGDAPECVQLLLDAGADKGAGDPTPIFYCMHESSDCLKHMINYGTDVNQSSEFDYQTKYPIYLALAANSPACITELVGAGAWVTEEEMQDYCYNPPLPVILEMRPVPVDALRALLAAAGERVLSEEIFLMQPLHWAVENSTVDGVRALVEAGADVNETFEDGGLLKYTEHLLSDSSSSSDTSRLTAIVDYLKSLPCFSEEQ